MTRKNIHIELSPNRSIDVDCDDYSCNDGWLMVFGDGLMSSYNISHVIAFHVKPKEIIK